MLTDSAQYPYQKVQESHNVRAATVGSVQHRFHCSSCGRNESLVISGWAYYSILFSMSIFQNSY